MHLFQIKDALDFSDFYILQTLLSTKMLLFQVYLADWREWKQFEDVILNKNIQRGKKKIQHLANSKDVVSWAQRTACPLISIGYAKLGGWIFLHSFVFFIYYLCACGSNLNPKQIFPVPLLLLLCTCWCLSLSPSCGIIRKMQVREFKIHTSNVKPVISY